MARIEIEAHRIARRFMHQQLAELRGELEGHGHTVSFRTPTQSRDLPTAGPGFDVALYLGEFLDADALEAIVAALESRIIPPVRIPAQRGRHRAAIFGPDGRVLRDVSLQEEEPGE
jgi:hypothetical protein